MEDAVGAGKTHHGAGEFAVAAVLIGILRGVKLRPDLLPGCSVTAPFEMECAAGDAQPHVDRAVLINLHAVIEPLRANAILSHPSSVQTIFWIAVSRPSVQR